MMLAAMQYRKFGNTEIEVSELGLGCSGLGGGLFRHDQAESAHVVHEAIERGVNFFDTADNYSLGESERILGQAFRGRRDKIVIATKVGARFGTTDVLLMKARPLMRPSSVCWAMRAAPSIWCATSANITTSPLRT